MRLYIEHDKEQELWRWICDCGPAGYWKRSSQQEAWESAMNHFRNYHGQYRKVIADAPDVQLASRSTASAERSPVGAPIFMSGT